MGVWSAVEIQATLGDGENLGAIHRNLACALVPMECDPSFVLEWHVLCAHLEGASVNHDVACLELNVHFVEL